MSLPSPFPLHTLPTVPLLQIARLLTNAQRRILSKCCRRFRRLIFESGDPTLDTRNGRFALRISVHRVALIHKRCTEFCDGMAFSIVINKCGVLKKQIVLGMDEFGNTIYQMLKCFEVASACIRFHYFFINFADWDVFMDMVSQLGLVVIFLQQDIVNNRNNGDHEYLLSEEAVNNFADGFMKYLNIYNCNFLHFDVPSIRRIMDRIHSICKQKRVKFMRKKDEMVVVRKWESKGKLKRVQLSSPSY